MSIASALKAKIHRAFVTANSGALSLTERLLLLKATEIAKRNQTRRGLAGLFEVEFCAHSQWGEDGIISWLVGMLPGIPRTFVEFGVVDYRESNTRLLLQMENWRGIVMDGSESNIADIRSQEISWRYDLTAVGAFIDCENINSLISDCGLEGDIGILSIDIDGNDYWVWKSIEVVNPVIVICEYNAVLGDLHELTIPYQADFRREAAHYSNVYFGASIRTLTGLAKRKGYTFVGTTSTGCNAFFIRNDFAAGVLAELSEACAFPSAVREGRNRDGGLTFASGCKRAEVIKDLPLFDLVTGEITDISRAGEMYSPDWKACRRTRI